MRANIYVKDGIIKTPVNVKDGEYVMTLEPKTSAKTLQQLRLLWGLIDAISISQNGDTTESMRIYLQALTECGLDTSYVLIENSKLKEFRKHVKNCVVIDAYEVKEKPMVLCKVCYKGASQMNRSEIAKLIDYIIKLASNEGLYEDYNFIELQKGKE